MSKDRPPGKSGQINGLVNRNVGISLHLAPSRVTWGQYGILYVSKMIENGAMTFYHHWAFEKANRTAFGASVRHEVTALFFLM